MASPAGSGGQVPISKNRSGHERLVVPHASKNKSDEVVTPLKAGTESVVIPAPKNSKSTKTVPSELQEIKLQLQSLNLNYSEMLSKVDQIACLVLRVEELEVKIVEMQQENEDQKKTISELQGRVNKAEQYTRRDSIELREIPVKNNENVEDIVLSVGENLNVPISASDISIAHRLFAKRGYIPGIIVKFTNRKIKNALIAKKRLLTLKQSDFVPGEYENDKIYIGESLSPYYRRLLADTKKKAKEEGYKFVWWKNGVCVRKEEKEEVIKIERKEDIYTKM